MFWWRAKKRKGFGVFNGSFETNTRYSVVIDVELKHKTFLDVFDSNFLSNLVEVGNNFFNFFQGGHSKKSFGNPALD